MRARLLVWMVAFGVVGVAATPNVAGANELADLSQLTAVLDQDGNLVDLSQLSRPLQHQTVRAFWTGTPEELRAKRLALVTEQYEQGLISESQYLAIADPEPGDCEYGPANPPEGMTLERLQDLLKETQGLAPGVRYQIILSEPAVVRESDDIVRYPVLFSIPAAMDADCIEQ